MKTTNEEMCFELKLAGKPTKQFSNGNDMWHWAVSNKPGLMNDDENMSLNDWFDRRNKRKD